MTGGVSLYLYVHLFGDFGTRGLPGTFKIFLVDVIVQMARSELVLTLPLAVYVDDSGLIEGALHPASEEWIYPFSVLDFNCRQFFS